MSVKLGEKIARVIAPEAVTLTADHVARLQEEVKRLRKLTDFQRREIKRLRSVNKERQDETRKLELALAAERRESYRARWGEYPPA